ncbi:hypothetical protein MAUB1S_11472 [Mycolicibacterium aubagnense]
MSRAISLNAARQIDATATDALAVFLVIIEHIDLAEPLRISSNNADRISTEPLTYGTRSTYGNNTLPDGPNKDTPKPFYFTGMQVIPPDDEDDTEPTATLVVDVLDTDIVGLLTSTTVPATGRIAIVMGDTPNLVEIETIGLTLKSANGDWGQVALKLSMADLYDEPFPATRMSKERFPGLHR